MKHANQDQIDEIDKALSAPLDSPGDPDELASILARALIEDE